MVLPFDDTGCSTTASTSGASIKDTARKLGAKAKYRDAIVEINKEIEKQERRLDAGFEHTMFDPDVLSKVTGAAAGRSMHWEALGAANRIAGGGRPIGSEAGGQSDRRSDRSVLGQG